MSNKSQFSPAKVQIGPSLIVIQGMLLTAIAFAILFGVDHIFHQHYMSKMLEGLTPNADAIAFGTLIGLPFFIFGELCWWLRSKITPENECTEDFLKPTSTGGYALMAIFSGLPEEVLLRGCIQPMAGIWIASALFAVMHYTGKRSIPYVITTFIYGMILGAIYIYTGNLWFCIMCHVVNNFLSHMISKQFRSLLPK